MPGAIHVSRAVRNLVPGEAWEATGGVQVRAGGVWLPTFTAVNINHETQLSCGRIRFGPGPKGSGEQLRWQLSAMHAYLLAF